MTHRLLLASLGRSQPDDRDHYGHKRLDLGGPLLAGLFRQLFRKLTRDARSHVQRSLDRGRDVNLSAAISKDTITRGLRWPFSAMMKATLRLRGSWRHLVSQSG